MIENFCDSPFWDLNQTWNNEVPDFSTCFGDVVLVSAPCLAFCVVLLICLFRLPRCSSHHHLPWTWLNITKLLLSLSLTCMSGIWLGANIHEKFSNGSIPHAALLSSSSRLVTFVVVSTAMLRHQVCGVTTSDALSVFWIISALSSIVLYRSFFLQHFVLNLEPKSGIAFALGMVYYPIIFVQLILSMFTDKKKFESLNNGKIMDKVSLLSSLTFIWFSRIVYKGRKTLLTVNDLAFTSAKFTASCTYLFFSKHWNFNWSQSSTTKSQSLAWALLKSFWPLIVIGIVLDLIFTAMLLIPPLILDRIINFVHDDHFVWRGYFYASLLFVVDFLGKIVFNTCVNLLICSGSQLQAALMGGIFRKNLAISTSTRKDFPSGDLMNLFSVDLKRIEYFSFQCATLISAPFKVVVIIVLLWQYIGPSTLAGVGVIVLMMPVTLYVSRLSEKFSDAQMKMKDIRLRHMNEILNGIKILKLYAWEIPFSAKVSEARQKEMKQVRNSQMCHVVTSFVYFCAPILVSLACFTTYLLISSDNVLDPTKAFVSLTLMDQMRYALFELPDAISELIQCNISLGRIRKFFLTENMDKDVVGDSPEIGEAISLRNASLTWNRGNDCVLHDMDLHLEKGRLMAIIGPVGSGKSSLIAAILGELYKEKGSVDVKGSVAYVPQQAWILNRTLKHNVLLVRHLVEEKYNKLLDLCCLRPDLDVLPAGDETEIGEKGVNLSGGQKQRVSLARAAYQEKDIYLLDDPLSAVDVHVRKSLFDDVIGNEGLLKRKTRILVTHDISVLHKVDVIVCMRNGRIEEMGTYQQLLEKKGSFNSFVEEHSTLKAEDIPVKFNRTLSRLKSSDSSHSRLSGLAGGGDCHPFEENEDKTHRLTEDEKMEKGGVSYKIYWNYVKHIGYPLFICSLFGYMSYVAFEGGANVWLSKWSLDGALNATSQKFSTAFRLEMYATLGLAQVLSVVFGSTLLIYGSTKASEIYHNQMLDSVMKSPMAFFDSTPMGRIVNRFSTDMDVMDIHVYYAMDGWLNCMFSILASFTIIGMNTPIFLLMLIPLAVAYYILQRLHLNTIRQTYRLESTTRSPVYSHFLESIQGVSSVCAYRIQKEFVQSFEEKVDRNLLCSLNTAFCNRWLGFWLDSLGSLIVLAASLLAIHYRDELNPAGVGLVITYALAVTESLKWFVRMNTEMENKTIAIERIDEYCHLKPEDSWDHEYDNEHDNWPSEGNIVFNNYNTRYRDDMDLVLKEINLSVDSSEKVGIIGRTGAGKSSITLALFRIIEPVSGTIMIDDVDISRLGLHKLRANLTIIPQDPVLFTGTLRANLDPNEEYDDDRIWESLERSHLKNFVKGLGEGLQHTLDEGGGNLSAGQRQLVCLARALLKNSRILVLDEATASVDMDTDSLIQDTIRTAFAHNTVITIAHRINTIVDYDKIVVLDNGHVVEVGSPASLLKVPQSRFYEMNKEAGLI